MGMFDNISCKSTLPLTEELKQLNVVWEDFTFQTKDLDCSLANYKITVDGSLVEEVVEREYEYYTDEEIRSKSHIPWSVYKSSKEINRYEKQINYHGCINFYSNVDFTDEEEFWIEFNAYFTYGKLDKIDLIECKKQHSHAISMSKWEAIRKEEAKKPWNRIKSTLNYVGWKWFWKKVLRGLYVTRQLMDRIHTLIIKHLL